MTGGFRYTISEDALNIDSGPTAAKAGIRQTDTNRSGMKRRWAPGRESIGAHEDEHPRHGLGGPRAADVVPARGVVGKVVLSTPNHVRVVSG
jgi:hypothetical protein